MKTTIGEAFIGIDKKLLVQVVEHGRTFIDILPMELSGTAWAPRYQRMIRLPRSRLVALHALLGEAIQASGAATSRDGGALESA